MEDKRAHTRIDEVQMTLKNHFEQITKLDKAIADNTSSLSENTRLTQDVANNTLELVELFKGVKWFRKTFISLTILLVPMYAFYLWIKGHG